MLGTLGNARAWRFAAVGKHPVARDYFRVGDADPLINGFAEWVGNGYRALEIAEKPSAAEFRSYRFFARGPGKELLACGILRDSSDAMGRPYPLVLMGCGPLAGWEESWDLLPLACEKTWEQMEQASAGAPGDVSRFESRVRGIRPPESGWADLAARRGTPAAAESGIAERIPGDLGRPEVIIPLTVGGAGDIGVAASLGFSRARGGKNAPPSAVFIGGTFERTGMALFNRSLTAADFTALWSGPSGEGRN